jgi:hypothetical protein
MIARYLAFPMTLLVTCLACTGEVQPPVQDASVAESPDPHVRTIVKLVGTAAVTRVLITITPAGVAQEVAYVGSDGSFSGVLVSEVGPQLVRAFAYAGTTLVGSGEATVQVTKAQTSLVSITILDTSGPAPVPDHSPVITSFVLPRTTLQVGDELALGATAVDIDGDPIGYAWSVAPAACGTFSDPASPSPTWTAAEADVCTLRLDVTAAGKTDTRSAQVAVVPATGSVGVTGVYVPYPRITRVDLLDTGTLLWSVGRSSSDATWHTPLQAGRLYQVAFAIDAIPAGTVVLLDSCGGSTVQRSFAPTVAGTGSGLATFDWTTSSSTGLCIVTARLEREGLVDSFPVVLVVGP